MVFAAYYKWLPLRTCKSNSEQVLSFRFIVLVVVTSIKLGGRRLWVRGQGGNIVGTGGFEYMYKLQFWVIT